MVIIYLFHYDRVTQAARKLGLTTKPGLATIPRRQNQSSDTQSNNLNECINRQCFHCIMHLPQYLSSANTSARWSGGRLRLDGAALGPAEGLLGSESFRNLNLPSSASRWRHHSSCGKGRSVHFGRKSPFPPPPFLQMPVFIFGLICLNYTPWPGFWLFLICALWQWVLNGEFGCCEVNVGFWRPCPEYDDTLIETNENIQMESFSEPNFNTKVKSVQLSNSVRYDMNLDAVLH